ncbi:MAG TPA: hypothetical protein VEY30_10285 [Myxococcaceae bacterium]|nr:hypothetical protein [Myxococcaceae bacterium]
MSPFSFLRSRKPVSPLAQGAQDQAERALAEVFRTLGRLCGQFADLVEAERLSRRGYEKPGKFLERLDENAPKPRG